jgi:hypothetical protein
MLPGAKKRLKICKALATFGIGEKNRLLEVS